jgi:hypothetical protein
MTFTLKTLFALACFTLIGCGGGVDLSALTSEMRSIREENARLAETNETLRERNEALMAGRPVTDEETSGGDTTPVVGAAPVAPVVGGGGGAPFMTAMPSAMPGVVPSCDGVDSAAMLASGMLTSSMAFRRGTQPWSSADLRGREYLIQNGSSFDVEVSVAGSVVHPFDGRTPLYATESNGAGYCAAPAIPSGMPGMTQDFVIPLVDVSSDAYTGISMTYRCYASVRGRMATTSPRLRSRTFYMSGGLQWQVTDADCM